jgi:hypothetical protein
MSGKYEWLLTDRQPAFWRGMGTLNMLTDVALILFPVHVIVTLQMSTSKKVTILTFFGARSLYVLRRANVNPTSLLSVLPDTTAAMSLPLSSR